jgi:molybdopterin-guanine dinucleotide biosynthesis protein A
MTVPPLRFSAVLLAGGKSTRMGCDKAGLIIDGQPLWRRQLATLRAVHPAELFISGRPDGPYMGTDVPVVFDAEPGLGPIGGLAAALRRAQCPYLLVLAVDLPSMTSDFLQRMIQIATERQAGVAPCFDDRVEPLAAIYPRMCLPLVEDLLRSAADHSLQSLIRAAVGQGLMTKYPWPASAREYFRNLNTPGDLGS